MTTIKVQRLVEDLPVPWQSTPYAAGYDLCSAAKAIVFPNQVARIPLGLKLEIPEHLFGMVRPRSGMGEKLTMPNSGIIDSDYRGQLFFSGLNITDKPLTIERFQRICQIIFLPRVAVAFVESEVLTTTQRGEGGLGHTGLFGPAGTTPDLSWPKG